MDKLGKAAPFAFAVFVAATTRGAETTETSQETKTQATRIWTNAVGGTTEASLIIAVLKSIPTTPPRLATNGSAFWSWN